MAWKRRRGQLRAIAEGLAKAGALQFGTFTLPDGSESPYYVNLEVLPSYPSPYRLVVDSMVELLPKLPRQDAVCSVPVSGLAIAAPIALAQGRPLFYTALGK
jgi:orotate phosphoribosyltransferase